MWVVFVLIMCEIIMCYGCYNIGFVWLFVELMLFMVGIVVFWNLLYEMG